MILIGILLSHSSFFGCITTIRSPHYGGWPRSVASRIISFAAREDIVAALVKAGKIERRPLAVARGKLLFLFVHLWTPPPQGDPFLSPYPLPLFFFSPTRLVHDSFESASPRSPGSILGSAGGSSYYDGHLATGTGLTISHHTSLNPACILSWSAMRSHPDFRPSSMRV